MKPELKERSVTMLMRELIKIKDDPDNVKNDPDREARLDWLGSALQLVKVSFEREPKKE